MPAGMRHIIILMIFSLSFCFIFSADASFHSGGIGSCGGCHVGGHGTEDGVNYTTGSATPLLRASDPSSICLNCHSGSGNSMTPSVFSFDGSALTPGGDFYWLTRSFSWSNGDSPGTSHGHNVVALDYGLTSDPENTYAPGGTYPASQLSCISCHDPHGRSASGTSNGSAPVAISGSYGETPPPGTTSGNYRLLGDQNYVINGFGFINAAPVARQNPASPFGESDSSHVDYGSGISDWCGNCHNGVINSSHKAAGGFMHPVNETLGTEIAINYNSYISTGNSNGIRETAYLQFVPFERSVSDQALLDPTGTAGPGSTAAINCLTCHRAHASAFHAAGRWDFTAALLSDSHPALGDSGASTSDIANKYYGRDITNEFGVAQGPFCEKCHSAATP